MIKYLYIYNTKSQSLTLYRVTFYNKAMGNPMCPIMLHCDSQNSSYDLYDHANQRDIICDLTLTQNKLANRRDMSGYLTLILAY